MRTLSHDSRNAVRLKGADAHAMAGKKRGSDKRQSFTINISLDPVERQAAIDLANEGFDGCRAEMFGDLIHRRMVEVVGPNWRDRISERMAAASQ